MKKIVYSQDYKENIKVIRDWLDLRFGKNTRAKHMSEIKERLTSLREFPSQGMSVRAIFGVDSDYEFIYVSHNYIFYYNNISIDFLCKDHDLDFTVMQPCPVKSPVFDPIGHYARNYVLKLDVNE